MVKQDGDKLEINKPEIDINHIYYLKIEKIWELIFIELFNHPIKGISKIKTMMHQGWLKRQKKCFTIDHLALSRLFTEYFTS